MGASTAPVWDEQIYLPLVQPLVDSTLMVQIVATGADGSSVMQAEGTVALRDHTLLQEESLTLPLTPQGQLSLTVSLGPPATAPSDANASAPPPAHDGSVPSEARVSVVDNALPPAVDSIMPPSHNVPLDLVNSLDSVERDAPDALSFAMEELEEVDDADDDDDQDNDDVDEEDGEDDDEDDDDDDQEDEEDDHRNSSAYETLVAQQEEQIRTLQIQLQLAQLQHMQYELEQQLPTAIRPSRPSTAQGSLLRSGLAALVKNKPNDEAKQDDDEAEGEEEEEDSDDEEEEEEEDSDDEADEPVVPSPRRRHQPKPNRYEPVFNPALPDDPLPSLAEITSGLDSAINNLLMALPNSRDAPRALSREVGSQAQRPPPPPPSHRHRARPPMPTTRAPPCGINLLDGDDDDDDNADNDHDAAAAFSQTRAMPFQRPKSRNSAPSRTPAAEAVPTPNRAGVCLRR